MTIGAEDIADLAVLWDLDGTLIDSKEYWFDAESSVMERFGGSWPPENAALTHGLGMREAAAILQEHGADLRIEEILDDQVRSVLDSYARRGVRFRPGGLELLRSIREAGIRTALVTMSARALVDEVLRQIPFDAFDVSVAGDEAAAPKPSPVPYLTAMSRLGVTAERCVVIEDSGAGIQAGLSAGAVVIATTAAEDVDDGASERWTDFTGRDVDDVREVLARGRATAELAKDSCPGRAERADQLDGKVLRRHLGDG
jgi:HAD superfamily hydrolase (TIGR01509 family)